MTQDGGYDLKPEEKPATPEPITNPTENTREMGDSSSPKKPGDEGWVPPAIIIEKADSEPAAAPDPDVETHKGIAVLAYICFLIPLVAAPNSKFARFHANQGLLSFILLVVSILGVALLYGAQYLAESLLQRIGILNWFFWCGLSFLQVALLVGWVALIIYGIIHAANGERKALPVVGHWTLIK
jgi:uncharacterized membrane protein